MQDIRELAERTLTTKEYAAWHLYQHRQSYRTIARHLGISLASVRERIKRADEKMERAQNAEANGIQATSRPRSARTRQERYADILKRMLADRDGEVCYLCRTEVSIEDLVIEHIIPRAAGGTDDPANIGLACFPCNTRKSDSFVSMLATSGEPVYHRIV